MTDSTERFRFLQISDVYLDCPFPEDNLALPPAIKQERNQEILATFVHVFELAREQDVDAVLIPGGLLDSAYATGSVLATLVEACASLKDIPVIIAPGYSDYYWF